MQRDKNIMKFMEDYSCGLTIRQVYRMFFKDKKAGEQMARKRLKILAEFNFLKYYSNPATSERVYYLEKKITSHDVLLMDFYSLLIFCGAEVKTFTKEPVFEFNNKKMQPDGFFSFKHKGALQACFVEVDFTHATNIIKFDPFYKNGVFREKFGGDPFIVIISENPKFYKTDLEVVYLNYDMLDFADKILID